MEASFAYTRTPKPPWGDAMVKIILQPNRIRLPMTVPGKAKKALPTKNRKGKAAVNRTVSRGFDQGGPSNQTGAPVGKRKKAARAEVERAMRMAGFIKNRFRWITERTFLKSRPSRGRILDRLPHLPFPPDRSLNGRGKK